jgi:NAD(P)-dependent dehydrogenase (short-subunit alcohol dehydrogenase family)
VRAALAEAGADVAVLSRTETELIAVGEAISDSGQRSFVIPCDVTESRQVDEAISALPALDIVVVSPGTNVPEPFVDVDEESFDRIIDINL